MKKHFFRMMLTLMLCLIPAAVYALDTDTWDGYLSIRSEAVEADADTFGMEPGTLLPVMGAPFEEAWRGAKGKAAVSLRESFSLLGTLQGQTWAMISYSISENADRIGWVRIDPDQCSLPGSSDMTVDRRLCRVLRKTPATDDPLESGRVIRTLSPGEEVIGILNTGDQICVETLVDGKTAWLFVRSEALEEIPLVSVEGHTVRVDDRVTVMGSCSVVPPASGNQSEYEWKQHTVILPGDIRIPALDFSSEEIYHPEDSGQPPSPSPENDWQLILPSSLRMLGAEAVLYASLKELRLPENLAWADSEALYGCSIGRLIFPAKYRGNLPDGYYLQVDAYEAEEGNPLYRTVDGVLFSADGKTLIRYPRTKAEDHYTVPAGVEVIASKAFSDDMMNLPLKSISLPIGLRRIEDYAFSGCGRLQSLTVPLTVTEIGEKAFSCCVSLERLSLPKGFSAVFHDDDYAQQADFTWYSGDNGETLSAPESP